MNKGYLDMAINYKRRLGCGDSFLATKQKGKKIEVKSDLLTEIYNNKIMKNIKKLIEEFQNEAKKRIVKGDFETVYSEPSDNDYYFGTITIKIDGCIFRFSLAKNKEVVCDLSDIKLYHLYVDEKEFRNLEKAYKEHSKDHREEQIQKLQDQIAELQK